MNTSITTFAQAILIKASIQPGSNGKNIAVLNLLAVDAKGNEFQASVHTTEAELIALCEHHQITLINHAR